MILTYKKIMDYLRCPLLYYFKHEVKLQREEKDSITYEDALRSVAMFYYYNLMNGVKPREEAVKEKWQKTWKGYDGTVEDILFREPMPDRKRSMNYNVQGIKSLEMFYETEMDQDFLPIVVNTEVSLRFGDHIMRDSIDLIREVKEDKKRKIEIVRILNSTVKSKNYKYVKDVMAIYQTMAFRELFEAKEDFTTLYNMYTGVKYIINYNENDFKRLESIVTGVGNAIEDKGFYPIESHQCTYCKYIDVCEKFKF